MSRPEMSIVIPCFNESENLPALIDKFGEFYQEGMFELVLVDNGSNDGSWDIMERYKKKFLFLNPIRIQKNVGYGHGIMTGLEQAKADVLAWTHADLQTDPKDVIDAFKIYAAATGKRVVRGRRVGSDRSLFDKIFTFGMSVVSSVVLGRWLVDINAQPKLFGRDFFEQLRDPPDDFSLDTYWLYKAKKCRFDILEIPVYFGRRNKGESKSAPSLKGKIKTSIRTLKFLFRLRKLHP